MSLQSSRRLALMSLAAIILFTIILGIAPRSASAQGVVFPPVKYSPEKQVELSNGPAVFPMEEPTVTAITYQVETSDPSIANVNVDLHNRTYVVEPLQVGTATVQVTWHDALGNTAAEKFAVMVHDSINKKTAPSVNAGYFRDLYLLTNESLEIDVEKLFPGNNPNELIQEFRYTIADTPDVYDSQLVVKPLVTYLTLKPKQQFDHTQISIIFTRADGIKASVFSNITLNEAPQLTTPVEAIQHLKGKETVLNLDAYFSDPNGDKLKYEITKIDPLLKVAPAILGPNLIVPAEVDQDFTIQIRADDLRLGTVEGEFNFQVSAVSLQEYAGSYEDTDNTIAVPIAEEGQYGLAPFQEQLSQVQGTELRKVDVPAGVAEVTFSLDQAGSQFELPAGIYGIYKYDASDVRLISVIELQDKQVLQQELLSIAKANGRAVIELPDVRQWMMKPENQSYKRIRMAMSFL